MIKTGWVMEWENEIRFRAPMRAHMNTMGKAMIPIAEAMRRFQVSFAEMTKGLKTLGQVLKPQDE
jgi:hypothetical protein